MKRQKAILRQNSGQTGKRQKYNLKVIIILWILFILTFNFQLACLRRQATFNLPKAHAQGLSLSISPPILEIMIKPGKSVTQVYKISNNGEAVVTTLKLAELTELGIKQDAGFVPESWITILDAAYDRPFLLPAGAEKQLTLRVNPPADIGEQDYYRALVVSTSPNPAQGVSMSSFSQQLAVPLLISVTSTGMLNKEAQIAKFDIPSIVDSFGPLQLNIEVKNTGRSYFRPKGKISLISYIGKGEYEIAPITLLAGQTKQLKTESQLGGGNRSPKTLSLTGFFLGKYQVEANFTLDESTIRISQKKTFYALPIKAGLAVLLGIGLGLIMYARRKDKKIQSSKVKSQNYK